MAVATSMLFAVSASATELAPRQQVESVQAAAGALPGGDAAKAVEDLDKGLEASLWVDDSTLSKDGKKVFDKMGRAAKKLAKIDAAYLADDLMAAGTELASIVLDAAVKAGASGGQIDKANKAMTKAASAAEKGKYDDAFDELKRAWEEAYKALDKLTNDGGGDDGKWAEYIVVLVRVDTIGTGNEVFIEVSGTNKFGTPGFTGSGNEGYLFSPHFSSVDTFHGDSLMDDGVQGIQLHVSCSDAFPDGYGAKSDPAMSANWIINTIDIVKYRNGGVDKTCGVVGTGLPVTPEVCVPSEVQQICP